MTRQLAKSIGSSASAANSPLRRLSAGGNIYWLDEEGKTTVTRSGKEFEKLAESDLEEQTLATPAFVDAAIFALTENHLYRIEKTTE